MSHACEICHRRYPSEMIQPMVTSFGTSKMCPICALKVRNLLAGLPEDTPFHGEIAQRLYQEAVQYNLKRSQKQ